MVYRRCHQVCIRPAAIRGHHVGGIPAFRVLAICAFWLGDCPFSLWIGRWFLQKDIRDYGDGNPGAVNVFLAGGRKAGGLALLLDVGKGVPFVSLSHAVFDQPEVAVLVIGMCAILGHAFSPILEFHGGKAVAVTFGVLRALPQHEALVSLAVATLLAFMIIDDNAWTVVVGASASLFFMVISNGNSWDTGFMLFVLGLYVFKFLKELRTIPRPGRLAHWLRSRR